jgi:hypothetical protein
MSFPTKYSYLPGKIFHIKSAILGKAGKFIIKPLKIISSGCKTQKTFL